MGIRNDKFTTWRFCLTVVDAIYQSAVCFGLPYMVFIGPKLSSDGYDTEGVYELGTFIAGIAVVVANTLVGLTIFSWTWIMFLCIVISSVTFFIWTGIYSHVMSFTFYGEVILFGEGTFWLCLILTFVVCLLPRFAVIYYLQVYNPYDNDIIREIVLCNTNSPLDNINKFVRNAASNSKRKESMFMDDDEEDILPINLTRTRSTNADRHQLNLLDSTSDSEEGSNNKKKNKRSSRFGLYRTTTTDSTKSEIMNMKTGKRTSFTGFAYSSDDHQVFDEYRKSVYRTQSTHHVGANSRLSMISLPPITDEIAANNENSQDWMPIDGFKLRKYDTEPSLFSSSSSHKKPTSFGKKMMKSLKNRMHYQQPYKKQQQHQQNLDPIMQTRDSSMDTTVTSETLLPLTPYGQDSFNVTQSNQATTTTLTNIEPIQPFLLHQHHSSSHHDSFDHQQTEQQQHSSTTTPPSLSSSSPPPPHHQTHY
jgi:phospholipid-translocating ATPase